MYKLGGHLFNQWLSRSNILVKNLNHGNLLILVGLFVLSFSGCITISKEINDSEKIQNAVTHQPTPIFTIESIPTPKYDDNLMVIGLGSSEVEFKHGESIDNSSGILLLDLNSQSGKRILEDGFTLLDYSSYNQFIFACNKSAIYTYDLENKRINQIADNLFVDENNRIVGFWVNEIHKLAYIGFEDKNNYVYLLDPLSGEKQKLTDNSIKPVVIFPTNDGKEMYIDYEIKDGTYETDYLTYQGEIIDIPYLILDIFPSPFGDKFVQTAYYSYGNRLTYSRVINIYSSENMHTYLYRIFGPKTDNEISWSSDQDIFIPNIVDLSWSPDGNRMFIAYYVKKNNIPILLVSTILNQTGSPIFDIFASTNPWIPMEKSTWSPDSKMIALLNSKDETIDVYSLATKHCEEKIYISEFPYKFGVPIKSKVLKMIWIKSKIK